MAFLASWEPAEVLLEPFWALLGPQAAPREAHEANRSGAQGLQRPLKSVPKSPPGCSKRPRPRDSKCHPGLQAQPKRHSSAPENKQVERRQEETPRPSPGRAQSRPAQEATRRPPGGPSRSRPGGHNLIGQHRVQEPRILFESVSIGRREPRISQEATGGRQDAARRPPEAQNRQGVLQHRPTSQTQQASARICLQPEAQEPRSGQNRSESAPRSQESSRQESEAIVGQNRSAGNKNNEVHNNRRQKETRGRQPKPHYTTPLADKRSFEPTKAAATQPKTNLLHVNLIHGSTLVENI